MYLTASLSPDNQTFFKAWENHTPWIVDAMVIGQFVSREWYDAAGTKVLKCSFRIFDTDMTISLLALPYEEGDRTRYSPRQRDIDWSTQPRLGEFWRLTIKSGFRGSYIWLSAIGD